MGLRYLLYQIKIINFHLINSIYMFESLIAIPILLLSFLLCMMVTYFLIIFFPKMGLVDKPDNRRLHMDATPTAGGVAVVFSFMLGFILLDYKLYSFAYSLYILPPIAILSSICLYDDIYEIPVSVRLAAHLSVAAFLVYKFLLPHQLFHGELGKYEDFILAFFALAGFCNIYNFMDGIDGITVSESVHLSLTIIILSILRYDVIIYVDLVLLIAVLVLVCSLAFSFYNWHPASIFIGDVGAISIGMLLGFCLMLIAASAMKLFVAVIIASLYYLADGGLTIIIRLFKGERIWLPHLNHFFQQAIRKNIPRKKITIDIILCNYWLMLLSISSLYYSVLSLALATIWVAKLLFKFGEWQSPK